MAVIPRAGVEFIFIDKRRDKIKLLHWQGAGFILYYKRLDKGVNHPGHMALPLHFPVNEIVIEPKEVTTGMKCIGREVTVHLELIPAKLFNNGYIRPKYIKPEDEETLNHKVVIAPLPVFPIEKMDSRSRAIGTGKN